MKYLITILILFLHGFTQAQTPLDGGFTYQGSLNFNSAPANGLYDFTFKLYNNSSNGSQIGSDVLADDVSVVDGVFTTIIDFNTPAFMGDKVWMEISVRPGAEQGGFQQLLPRQQITSTPYAIHAQFVGADAVSSIEIQNGSIANIDLANDSVTADKIAAGAVGTNEIASGSVSTVAIIDNAVSNAKIASDAVTKDKIGINSVGTTEIISSQVQRRIGNACTSGSYINTVNEDGTVVCAVDQSGSSNVTSADIVNGTIATVDLADNSITSAKIANNSIDSLHVVDDSLTSADILNGTIGTFDLANNSVTFAKIADDSVGIGKVISNQVQLRINNACASGTFIESVNEDGTVNCAGIGMINGQDLVDGSIQSNKLANSSVTTNKIASEAVTGFNIAPFTIQASNLANNSVNTFAIVDDSITSDDILNATIGNIDLANDSIALNNMTNNSVGSNEIIDGTVATIDLVDNSITNSKIASNAVAADEISANAVGMSEIISSQVQRRVSSSCDAGFYLSGINEDGSVQCQQLPIGLDFIVDNIIARGKYSSIAIGSNGFPIISYYDDINKNLMVVVCKNSSCSSTNTPITLDSTGDVGWYTNIAIGLTGVPVINYFDKSNNYLKIVSCISPDCITFNSPVILDGTGNAGARSSLAIGPNSFPVSSYYNSTNKSLMFVTCTNASCSTFNMPIELDSLGDVGLQSSLAFGFSGYPSISYNDSLNGTIKFISCLNADCSTANIPLHLNIQGDRSKLTFGFYGDPVIAYYRSNNGGTLNLLACATGNCSSFNPSIELDSSASSIGFDLSITLGNTGFPVISYYDLSNGNLKFINCNSVYCSIFEPPITLDSTGNVGDYPSITIGANGFPVISYYDASRSKLKVYSCGNQECSR